MAIVKSKYLSSTPLGPLQICKRQRRTTPQVYRNARKSVVYTLCVGGSCRELEGIRKPRPAAGDAERQRFQLTHIENRIVCGVCHRTFLLRRNNLAITRMWIASTYRN